MHRVVANVLLRVLSWPSALILLAFAVLPLAAQQPNNGPPPAVTVKIVELQDAVQQNSYIGRVTAIEAVDLRARVAGFIERVSFDEGQNVAAGDVVFEIEPDQYEAEVSSANASVLRARAQLREAERSLTRAQELFRRDNISEARVDEAQTARDSALADVRAAEALLRQAELNLSYTRITAPIDGRIGRAEITAGNLVGPDSGSLARVVQLDPIRVVFSVSDRELLEARESLGARTQEELEAAFIPSITLPNGQPYSYEGVIEFSDNEINPDTGTISVFALFDNPDAVLLPGQLVTVSARLQEQQQLPAVPQAAVQQDRDGRFVLLVNDDDQVVERRVKIGAQSGTMWLIEEGLEGGERVIFQGLQRARPGIAVNPTLAGDRS